MLGIDVRTARSVWTAALVLVALASIYLARKTLFVFTLAVLLAYLLSPLVDLLYRVLPGEKRRTPALAVAYVIFIGALVVIGGQIGAQVVEQANALSRRAPEMLARWEAPARSPGTPAPLQEQALERIRAEITRRSGDIFSELPKAGIRLLSLASNLIDLIIIPVLAFLFLKDGREIRENILGMVSEGPQRVLLDDVMADMHVLLAQYMRALVLLSLSSFACFSIALSIIGVPYGILLATVACLLEFIPMLGPLAAGVMVVIVAAISGSHVAAVLVFLVAFRMFQDYLLSPRLMASGVELHPLLVMFGVFAGSEVAGIPGTFLSVPVLAAARVLWVRVRKVRAAAQRAALDRSTVAP